MSIRGWRVPGSRESEMIYVDWLPLAWNVNEAFLSLTIPSRHSLSNWDPASYSLRGQQGPFHLLVTRCQTQPAGTEASDTHLPTEPGHCTIPIPQHLATCQLPPRGPLGRAEGNSCETACRILPACSRAGSPACLPSLPPCGRSQRRALSAPSSPKSRRMHPTPRTPPALPAAPPMPYP